MSDIQSLISYMKERDEKRERRERSRLLSSFLYMVVLVITGALVELEITQSVSWLVFKKRIREMIKTKKTQRQKDIEKIAKSMGYEPQWIEPLFMEDYDDR